MKNRSRRPNPFGLRVVTAYEDWARDPYPTLAAWELAETLAMFAAFDRAVGRKRIEPRPLVLDQLCLFLAVQGGVT